MNFEAGAAWLSDKKIIPVCVGTLSVGTLPKPYSDFQGLRREDDGPYHLIRAIDHYLDPAGLAPPPLYAGDSDLISLRTSIGRFAFWSKTVNKSK